MFSIPKHKNKMEVHNEQCISMPGKPAELRKWQIRRKYRDIKRIKTFVSQKQAQIKIPSGMQEMATCDIFIGDHAKVHFLSFYLKHVQQFLLMSGIQTFSKRKTKKADIMTKNHIDFIRAFACWMYRSKNSIQIYPQIN